jgi:hypothetical protein
MATRSIPPYRKLLYYGIMIFLFLLVIELCCRGYYYQAFSPAHPVATIRLLKDIRTRYRRRHEEETMIHRLRENQYLVRPGLSHADNDEIARECVAANRAVYEPWLEFAFMDVRSKYVNVADHHRFSTPDRSDPTAKDPLCIYFLGGSTMYGFDVTDAETIPSAFVRAYNQRYPGGRPIRVVNLGIPFYFSYQELIQLSDRLFRDDHPSIVIMLDGLNDCFEPRPSIDRTPTFALHFQDQVQPGDVDDPSQHQTGYYELPPGMSIDSACALVASRYLDNIRHAHDLAGIYHIPLYCFWQPVPFFNYPNRLNDPICTQSDQPRFGKVYPLIRDTAAHLSYLTWLGDMLHDEKGLPFVDQYHYSPSFNRAIAEKMLSRIDFGQ